MQDIDRDAAIQRLYDVALDPGRYETLLDQWEAMAGPLRCTPGASPVLDDAAMRSHFERAEQLLDHLPVPSQHSPYEAAIAEFDRVPAVVLDPSGRVLASNAATQAMHGFKPGMKLQELQVHADDVDAVSRILRDLFSGSDTNTAMLRLRSLAPGGITLIRFMATRSEDGAPIVIAASNEIHWPDGMDMVLQQTFSLTSAEVEILRALVQCESIADIAETRGRSVGTVRTQVKTLLSKTDTRSQTELVRLTLSMMDLAATTKASAALKPRALGDGMGKLEQVPFHSWTTPDGRNAEYLILGDPAGAPVLFLPLDYGLVRWPASAEAEAAALGLRIIVPVRAGYGASDMIARGASYDEALIADTLGLLDLLGVQSCPMISLGGDSYYAMALAAAAPGRINAIVACGGVLPMTRKEQYDRMDKWHRFILAGARYTPSLLPFMVKAGFMLARRIGKRGFIHAVYGNCPADVETFEDAEVFEAMVTGSLTALSDDHSAHEAFARQVAGPQAGDWSDLVRGLEGRVPVMFLNGLQDPEVKVETLREFQEDFPWIDYTEYADAGQLLFFRHWRDVLGRLGPYL